MIFTILSITFWDFITFLKGVWFVTSKIVTTTTRSFQGGLPITTFCHKICMLGIHLLKGIPKVKSYKQKIVKGLLKIQ